MPTKQSKGKPKDQGGKPHATGKSTDANDMNHSEDNVDFTEDNQESHGEQLASDSEETVDPGHGGKADHESDSESSREHSKEDSTDEVKLEFPYAELVRAYAPKAMDVAEKVATDWKKDGSFMNLGIENAYANMAVSLGLQKAKELEKKLDEKGVLSAVRMGVEVLKDQVKQQVNKKK